MGHGYKPPPQHKHKTAPLATPVQIIEKLSPLSYRIDLPEGSRIHPVVSIVHLRPYNGGPGSLKPLPILDSEGQDIYEVEKVVGERTRQGKKEYLVQWKGYTADERTWEPVSHLDGSREALQDWVKQKKLEELEEAEKEAFKEERPQRKGSRSSEEIITCMDFDLLEDLPDVSTVHGHLVRKVANIQYLDILLAAPLLIACKSRDYLIKFNHPTTTTHT
jgi:hypothetical protein